MQSIEKPVFKKEHTATAVFHKVLLFLILSWVMEAPAQNLFNPDGNPNFVYRNWNNQSGLPQNSVFALVQDKTGYLWGGTEDGLFRFDGSEFMIINETNTPGLTSSAFFDLIVSGDDLWASSRNSLIRIQNKVEQILDFSKHVEGGWIKCIEKDEENRIWVGTSTGDILYVREDSIFTTPQWVKGTGGSIECLTQTSEGMIIGTAHGLYKMKDVLSHSELIPHFNNMAITAIAVGKDNELWIGTANMGLYQFKGDTVHYSEKNGLKEGFVNSLHLDNDGKLWIGLRSAGYQILKDGKFSAPHQTVYAHDGIRSMLVDDHMVWMGTNSSGLLQLKPALISVPSIDYQLAGKITLAIYQHPGGETWIGTAGMGVHRYHEGKLTRFDQTNGLSNNLVLSIYGKDEYIYLGTSNGLDRFNRTTNVIDRNYNQSDGLTSNGAVCIFKDSRNQLWVSTRLGGLHRLQADEKFELIKLPASLRKSNLISVFEDSQQNLWFGSRGAGMLKIDTNENITSYQHEQGFPGDIVYGFFEDKEGSIWMTTEKGLAVMHKGKFRLFTKEHGLLFNESYRMMQDSKGFVWLSGNLGLQRISETELLKAKKTTLEKPALNARLFNALDGMPNSETNGGFFPAGWKMNDGSLWFPTGRGVAIADPSLIHDESNNLSVLIQSLRFGNQEFHSDESIKIPPGVYNFEIRYTSIDFLKGHDIQFFYRLKGLNSSWIKASHRKIAYFSSLDPGDYTFEVRAERYGVSSPTAVLNFRIRPHFYQSLLFRILTILLTIIAIASVIYSLRKAARRKIREQQRITRAQIRGQEKERQLISTELHDSISQQLSAARLYLDVARTQTDQKDEWIQKSEQVIRNVITEIRSLCNSLTPPSLKDIGLKEAIDDLLNVYTSVGKFRAHLEYSLNQEELDEDLQFTLFRITQELINNIARHSQAKNVWLSYHSTTTGLRITVRDDGKGFDSATKPFGVGFENIQNRLKLYDGGMEVKSAEGQGCLVDIHANLEASK